MNCTLPTPGALKAVVAGLPQPRSAPAVSHLHLSAASLRPQPAARLTILCCAAPGEPAAVGPPAAAVPEAAESAAADGALNRRPSAMTPAWQHAIDRLQSGEAFTTTIQSVNKSGVLVEVGKLSGFIPYKLMNRALLASMDRANWTQKLVGREIIVKVTQVVVPERRLICSEKAAMLDIASAVLKTGEVVAGTVTSLHSFGAFVEVEQPPELAGTEVILPLREVSWDWISTVNAKLTKGQRVVVKVVEVKTPPRPKVVVSLKRMEEDPLKETLDKVLPLSDGAGVEDMGAVPASVPSGVEDILNELSREDGVRGVTLGRRVEEQRTVSQDLELWISREAVADGFNLVARTGRVVQEIRVSTGMGAEEMRQAVQRVLKRVN